ncbi:MAG TPA: hypothetical protein DF292_07915 [Firmicutes bacterium]|nr:hypothetical protein [Bacillota bacterium]HCT36940.1 hypothetical protein [Bacillota bacterium]
MRNALSLITFTIPLILLVALAEPVFGAEPPDLASRFSLAGGAAASAAGAAGDATDGGYFLSGAILDDLLLLYSDWTLTPVETMLTMSGGLVLLEYDKPIYDFILKHEPEVVDKYISPFFSKLGEWPALMGLTGVMVFVDPELSKEILLALLVDTVNTQVLKCLIGMSRPYVADEPQFIGPTFSDDYKAMPSGHTSSTFAVATVLALRYPKYSWLFYGAASLIGASRITEEQHWPSNVFFGAMVGVASARQVHEHRLDLVVLRLQF